MADYVLDRTYSETMEQLTTKTPASADTFNPIINQLLNNDAHHKDSFDSVATQINTILQSEMIPTLMAIPLNGLTMGDIYLPRRNVILDTITLG